MRLCNEKKKKVSMEEKKKFLHTFFSCTNTNIILQTQTTVEKSNWVNIACVVLRLHLCYYKTHGSFQST